MPNKIYFGLALLVGIALFAFGEFSNSTIPSHSGGKTIMIVGLICICLAFFVHNLGNQSPSNSPICTTCNKEYSSDDTYCSDCGSLLIKGTLPAATCNGCGETIQTGSNFCPNCGNAQYTD